MSFLSELSPTPPDVLMQAARIFASDQRKEKVNLGVGIYYGDDGRVPVLACVREAAARISSSSRPWSYLLAEGLPAFRENAIGLVLGREMAHATTERTYTIQTLGGTGAIRLAAELIKDLAPRAKVAVSTPGWPNHAAIFTALGLEVVPYPYYDKASRGLDPGPMLECLNGLPEGSVVVLHSCCHNPTGCDPSEDQWQQIVETLMRRRLIPLMDVAYPGFGDGIARDSAPTRLILDCFETAFVAASFSKSFSLYGERVGALSVLAESGQQAALAGERLRALTRTLNSTPPSNGALLVAEVATDSGLRTMWTEELECMRLRVMKMRGALVDRLQSARLELDFSFISNQKGLFSYSGLSAAQVAFLRDQFAVHAVDDGRLCLAALTTSNIDYVADAIGRAYSLR